MPRGLVTVRAGCKVSGPLRTNFASFHDTWLCGEGVEYTVMSEQTNFDLYERVTQPTQCFLGAVPVPSPDAGSSHAGPW